MGRLLDVRKNLEKICKIFKSKQDLSNVQHMLRTTAVGSRINRLKIYPAIYLLERRLLSVHALPLAHQRGL